MTINTKLIKEQTQLYTIRETTTCITNKSFLTLDLEFIKEYDTHCQGQRFIHVVVLELFVPN